MIFILCKKIISFVTGLIFLKFLFRTIWIMLISAITCSFIIRYFLPTIVVDFGQKTVLSIEKKMHNKVNHIKKKLRSKKVIKKINKLKDRVN